MAYIAIDIGGSMIKAAVISASGDIIDRSAEKTPLNTYAALLKSLSSLVEWGQTVAPIEGVALSQPCVTDEETSQALSEGALIYIKGKNPAKDMGTMFDLPYSADNDGNCAALAEVWLGSAKDVSDMAFVVCGTGVGGAVVKNRVIHSGAHKFAGEFGIMITGFEQNTGVPIVWSDTGSTFALVKHYADTMNIAHDSVNGKQIFDLAESGDEIASACIREFYRMFAVGIHNVQHVYDPQVILIGGGISAREDIVDEINIELSKLYEHFKVAVSMPTVRRCTFEADANLIGAVYHHLNRHKSL
ncbi:MULTISPECIES: ROK family protein [unclassified Fusibacter]|uniref:ROK family protein n=1 Tax=unclassified Fusibacter TaxID=2624464 RepID=UPI0010115A1E|nr:MULTISPECIES: ROK family protein [unclassified Fusibacter]MCK8058945.1 ROK family protein [Fusibacter sp. A2]NPE22021.1 ROK family protein [Fusibacter sp. A1]RXV61586.1 ROK family protein [Fusibacter sp. A1]